MTSSLYGLYNAQRSLAINQAALDIVSNNIANINTEGYSRQRLEISQVVSNRTGLNSMYEFAQAGNGATIDAITRSHDLYLDNYYRNENTTLSYYSELYEACSSMEDITNGLSDTGLMKSLDDFYKAAQALSSKPTDAVTRNSFLQTAENLCTKFNQVSDQLTDLRERMVGNADNTSSSIKETKLYMTAEELNKKLGGLADLNKTISMSTAQGITPNSLLDQRDALLDELSEYLPLDITIDSVNMASIKLNGVDLVTGGSQVGFLSVQANTSTDAAEREANPAIVKILDADGNETISDIKRILPESKGAIGAMLDIGGDDSSFSIKSVMDELDDMASEFALQLNSLQVYQQTDADGNITKSSMCLDDSNTPATLKMATENLFLDEDDTTANITASNIHLNAIILENPNEIATAVGAVTQDVDGNDVIVQPNATGDGSNALLMAQTRNKAIEELNGSTVEGFFSSLTGTLGVKTESLKTTCETQGSVVDQITNKKESYSGVSLDEEFVDLTKFQRAYEASAKIFNVVNEILETIMGLGR